MKDADENMLYLVGVGGSPGGFRIGRPGMEKLLGISSCSPVPISIICLSLSSYYSIISAFICILSKWPVVMSDFTIFNIPSCARLFFLVFF